MTCAGVLPTAARLRRRSDFALVLRRRARVARGTVVVHYARRSVEPQEGVSPRVGLIVSRQVGGAVVRNRVKRRLRAVLRRHLSAVPADIDLVVRAQASAARAASSEMEADVASALRELSRREAGTP